MVACFQGQALNLDAETIDGRTQVMGDISADLFYANNGGLQLFKRIIDTLGQSAEIVAMPMRFYSLLHLPCGNLAQNA